MSARCFAGSISNTPRRRSGIPYVLIMNPKSTTTATASCAIYIERFSHNSRHTDQRSGRVLFVASTSCRWVGTFSDGLFIWFPPTADYGPQTTDFLGSDRTGDVILGQCSTAYSLRLRCYLVIRYLCLLSVVRLWPAHYG